MSQSSPSEPSHLAEQRFEYAWRWFVLHASQRISMFNFFLIGAGILANAYALMLRDDLDEIAGGMAVIGAVVSLAFIGLDRRNRQLVHMAEQVLKNFETETLFLPTGAQTNVGQTDAELGLLQRENILGGPRFYFSHWFLIEGIQAIACVGFTIAAWFAFFR